MKIAIVDPSGFTPPYNHHLCKSLANRNHDVYLISSETNDWEADDYQQISFFYNISHNIKHREFKTWVKGIEHIKDMVRLLEYIHQLEPDIIHFQWLPVPVFDQFLLPMFRRYAPLVLTKHDIEPFHGEPTNFIQRLAAQDISGHFDKIIVHTEQHNTHLINSGTDRDLISVVPHGVIKYPSYESPEDMTNEELTVILFFGLIKEYKGLDLLLDAFAQLPKETQRQSLVKIAGKPIVNIQTLKRKSLELGIEQHLDWETRYINHEEVATLFQNSDIVTLPYRKIDQSGVLMTALNFGKPIIATDIGGFSEVLEDGVHGRLVKPNDTDQLASSLHHLIQNKDVRNRMGKQAKSLADSKYSWDNIAEQMETIYSSLRRTNCNTDS